MRLPRSVRLIWATTCLSVLSPTGLHAALIDSPTTQWTPVAYTGTNQNDYYDDQQTGNGDSDIVGDATHAGVYRMFDSGNVYFRVRLGDDAPQAGTFDNSFLVGMDANLDGALDIFFGVHNQGSTEVLAIWDAGTGLNVSPSTTSVVSPPYQTFTETATNYDFQAVNATIDPNATSFDLDGTVNKPATDFFLSFSMSLADIAAATLALSGLTITEATQVGYVFATSNQDNALNQDLNGVQGGTSSTLTWTQLGAISTPGAINPGAEATPEPTSLALGGVFCLIAGLSRRRLRSQPAC
jgi:hypothetical protein